MKGAGKTSGKGVPPALPFVALGWIGLCLAASARSGDETVPAAWVEEILAARGHLGGPPAPGYERELAAKIRERILAAARSDEAFAPYRNVIPSSGAAYEMLAIEGGSFTMGSPREEEGRKDNEDNDYNPVSVSSFWMGKFEVTWGQFLPFAWRKGEEERRRNGAPQTPSLEGFLHWISSPTQPHTSPDFGMGLDDDHPAVGMSQHAANKFCQWLSLQTGHFYRLPTEAEWEYACRAGTTGPYSCPTDQLADFAVMDPDMIRVGYEKVGTKKPNPWGLHDMHGNVMEWCLDGYTSFLRGDGKDPWIRAKQLYPRVARGGSWYDPPEELRSARRHYSRPHWNMQDPEPPKSQWWLTDGLWIGFRLVRPLAIPSEDDMFEAWNTGAMHQQDNDVIP